MTLGVVGATTGTAAADPVTINGVGTFDVPGVPAQTIDLPKIELPKVELPQLPPAPALPPLPELQPVTFDVPAVDIEAPPVSIHTAPGQVTVTPNPFGVVFTQNFVGEVAPAAPAVVAPPAPPAKTKGELIAERAEAQLGTPYVWGGNQPGGFDCSGLVQYSYAQEGVSIARVSNDQIAGGTQVPLDQLQPGDVVSFYGGGHVGIYAGNGEVIHSPTSGDVVKRTSLAYMKPDSATRYA